MHLKIYVYSGRSDCFNCFPHISQLLFCQAIWRQVLSYASHVCEHHREDVRNSIKPVTGYFVFEFQFHLLARARFPTNFRQFNCRSLSLPRRQRAWAMNFIQALRCTISEHRSYDDSMKISLAIQLKRVLIFHENENSLSLCLDYVVVR